MMTWAETAAKNEGITREAADQWALESHRKAIQAMDSGKFKEEIVPLTIKQKKGDVRLDEDETPRRNSSMEKLAKLKTVYPDGICTAGNSSSENDAAAALVLTTAGKGLRAQYPTAGLSQIFRRCRCRSVAHISGSTCSRQHGPWKSGVDHRGD